MRVRVAAALVAVGIFAAGLPLHAQSPEGAAAPASDAQTLLAGANALRCTFTMSTRATWNKEGAVQTPIRRTGRLVVTIQNINPGSGSALLITTPINKDLTLLQDERNRYFLDAGGGKVTVTTVMGDFSTGQKFKASHSIHDFTLIEVASFRSEPEVVQHWGDCEITTPVPVQ
jgi:hypothetical protein